MTAPSRDWFKLMRMPPWKHQLREWEQRDVRGRMWRWQMRTGKTKTAIDLSCYRYMQGELNTVLIAAPNNVHANWTRKELPKHAWECVDWKSFTWDATKSRRPEFLAEWERALNFDGLLFISINAEAWSNLRFKQDFLEPLLKKRRKYGMIGDEIHDLCRQPNGARSKMIRRVSRRAIFRRALSGTITDNSPLHAWAQYDFVEKGALGEKYSAFEAHHAVMNTIYVAGGRKLEQPSRTEFRNLDELQAQMAPWTSVVLRSECDDMPDIEEVPVVFDLHPNQRRIYNDVVDQVLTRLDSGEIIPPKEGGAVKIQLQQIASGWFTDEEGEVHEIVHNQDNPRLKALESVLALHGRKVVIWCRYREDIVRVLRHCKFLGYNPVHYYGGTPKKDRPVFEDRYMNDPLCGPMVAQPQACGQGLDFSAGRAIVWYSYIDGDLIRRKQANERCTQMGGGSIEVANLVARGTVDESYLADFGVKDFISEELSGEGLRRFLERVK